MHEAVSMYKIVSKNVHTELIICEMEGHGMSSVVCRVKMLIGDVFCRIQTEERDRVH